MDTRAKRIVETAIELAESDGYAAVRLRDIASRAGVALGTVYNRFKSKEEILVAVMATEAERIFASLRSQIEGATPVERANNYFDRLTDVFLARPNLARAILRSLVGDGDIAGQIGTLQEFATSRLESAIEGPGCELDGAQRTEIATMLQQIWFALLIGWSSGLNDRASIRTQLDRAIRLVLA